jgi:photosystem I reaction center subunit XII
MPLSEAQVFSILAVALLPAIFAVLLGSTLARS